MAVEAGTQLGRCLVHEYLGQGTLGAVYRAFAPNDGSVAVKVLPSLASAESRELFKGIAPRLEEVSHPNLLRVLDHGERDGVPYLIEEYVQGENLSDRFGRATVRPIAALSILRGVAAAVDHAHRNGLCHGDLKPSQVLLAEDGRAVLSDLGLAPMRPIRPQDHTPEYAAPELIRGGPFSPASDRYAFAAMAYQLLVDRLPFEGQAHAIFRAHLTTEPEAPSRANRVLSPAADPILLRGLAKDPSDRWPSCSEMVSALIAVLDCREPPGPRNGGSRVPWRPRWPYGGGAVEGSASSMTIKRAVCRTGVGGVWLALPLGQNSA
jgi:serine/threonine protein kinase